MRVNVYAEELTDRVEIVSKEIDGKAYTGVRFYLELPATVADVQYQGPFIHSPGDDDSSAVTFWGKQKLRDLLVRALDALDAHETAELWPQVTAQKP
jgi:3-deoxy-D-arabino-heptulosonate 7-phosphate (DAHP) synthase